MRASTLLCALTAASVITAIPALAHERDDWGAVCAVGRIHSPDVEESPGRRPRFRASEVIGIEFEVATARVPEGAHRLQLRLFTPQGYLYQTLSGTLEVAPSRHRHRRPKPAQPVRVRLSVPGSPIVTHSIYGRWKAAPYLDGAEEPCGQARSFWIDSDQPRQSGWPRGGHHDPRPAEGDENR